MRVDCLGPVLNKTGGEKKERQVLDKLWYLHMDEVRYQEITFSFVRLVSNITVDEKMSIF